MHFIGSAFKVTPPFNNSIDTDENLLDLAHLCAIESSPGAISVACRVPVECRGRRMVAQIVGIAILAKRVTPVVTAGEEVAALDAGMQLRGDVEQDGRA